MNLQHCFGAYDPPRSHFVDILRYWAEQAPESVAYYFSDGEGLEDRLTYAGLWEEVRALAGYLQGQGAAGERVLLFYPPGLDFVIGFYACHAAGAIAVPAFPPRRNRKATRIRSIAEDAAARFGLSVSDVVDQIRQNSGQMADLSGVRLLATDLAEAREASAWTAPALDPDDIAVLQYTSGSTGSPKGVMLSHANLVRNCELICYAFEPSRSEGRGLTWLPTYHDMGLVGGVLNPLFLGLSNVLMSPMAFLQRPIRWLRMISRYGVTISGGPNFAFQLCVDKIEESELEGLDLSSWVTAFNGAEPIRERTLRQFHERFARFGFKWSSFLPCYGMAETTLIVTGGPRDPRPVIKPFEGRLLDEGTAAEVKNTGEASRTLVGCGEVLPGEVVKIVDPETRRTMERGEIGEIWIQGPCVGHGYWHNPEATERTFNAYTVEGDGPFLRTGDLGFLHVGQLFVTGRLKDLIIIRGVNRYPQDIEQSVERASSVVQTGSVAAFAMEHEGREQLVIVAETLRHREADWDEEIQAIRRAVTAEHELPPDAVYLVRNSSVPKTSSGKIQRHACHHAVRDGELKLIACWVRWEEMHGASCPADRGAVMQAAGGGNVAEEEAGGGRSRHSDPEILAAVMHQVRTIARERATELAPSTNVVLDLGLDSLERLQIAHALEQLFGGRFPEEVLQEIETVEEVALAIEEHLSREGIAKAKALGLGSLAGAGASSDANGAPAAPAGSREIPAEEYRFEQFPEYRRLKQTMGQLLLTGVPNPYFSVHAGTVRDTTRIDGRSLVSFSSYNYLGMSGDPRVNAAAHEAIDCYGTSVSASRLVSGEKPIHRALETGIAEFLGVDDSIVMVGGHSTNETTIGHLVGPGDLIVHDALSHNSIIQGAILSGARRRPFPHNDYGALDALLTEVRGQYRRVLVVVEGVYSMDGDYPNLPAFVRVKERHRCLLMVDEAHSIGTMGATGRGIGEHFGIDPRGVDIWMGTLSKSFGSCGGYIAGSAALVELLRYTAPGFVFSVGIPPASAAAAVASLEVLREEPQRVRRLQERSRLFLDLAKAAGLNTGSSAGTPVIPVITGNSLLALRLSHRLFLDGINVQPILYPAVEEAAARLRFFITSTHSEEQIRQSVEAVARRSTELGIQRRPGKSPGRTTAVAS